MKRLALLTLLSAVALSAADVSGLWIGAAGKPDTKYGAIPYPVELTLKQNGDALTGSILIDKQPFSIANVQVNGSAITFSVTANNSLLTVQVTEQGNELIGRITTDQGEVHTLDLKKH